MRIPRVLIGAGASNSGKTIFTSVLLHHFLLEGKNIIGYKCGPDYIDPMYHKRISGVECRNLDPFFLEEDKMKSVLLKQPDCDLAVLEGVMGYYDGGAECELSTYEVARRTKTPAVLLVDAKGCAMSSLAAAAGYCSFMEDSEIKGVIFNRMSSGTYAQLQKMHMAKQMKFALLGYIPKLPKECEMESRHLGLVTAEEVDHLQEKIALAHEKMKDTVDWKAIWSIARQAGELSVEEQKTVTPYGTKAELQCDTPSKPVVAVAKDEAFCFYYEDNLDLLLENGLEISYFSPLRNEPVPREACGIYLGGGYPELYAERLASNEVTKQSIRALWQKKIPCIAECGGFLYLQESMEGKEMCGVLPGESMNTGHTVRFGYVTLTAGEDSLLFAAGDQIRGHEFHYFDTTQNGSGLVAEKLNHTKYACSVTGDTLYAGFVHLSFRSLEKCAKRFADKCSEYMREKQ